MDMKKTTERIIAWVLLVPFLAFPLVLRYLAKKYGP